MAAWISNNMRNKVSPWIIYPFLCNWIGNDIAQCKLIHAAIKWNHSTERGNTPSWINFSWGVNVVKRKLNNRYLLWHVSMRLQCGSCGPRCVLPLLRWCMSSWMRVYARHCSVHSRGLAVKYRNSICVYSGAGGHMTLYQGWNMKWCIEKMCLHIVQLVHIVVFK